MAPPDSFKGGGGLFFSTASFEKIQRNLRPKADEVIVTDNNIH